MYLLRFLTAAKVHTYKSKKSGLTLTGATFYKFGQKSRSTGSNGSTIAGFIPCYTLRCRL